MSKFLIHVGYPKAGSCFLGEWFHRHPAFAFKDFKLAGIDSTSDLCKYALSKHDEVKYMVIKDMIFSSPMINENHGVSNINEYQQKVCKTLFDLFPDSKILIVTRGFKSAMISGFNQYVKEGGIYSKKELFDKYKKSNWLIYNYSFLINLYNQYFGKENVIVVPYEFLKDNPNKFLNYLEEKLNVPASNIEIGELNVSMSPNMIYTRRRLNISMNNISKALGRPGKILLKWYLKKLDSKKNSAEKTFLLLRFFSVFCKGKKEEDILIPQELLSEFKKYSNVLNEYKIFDKYIEQYFI